MEKRNTKKITTMDMVVVGLMTALVFVFTFLRIEIPTPLGKTMLHLGNVMCLLSALLFGPTRGALAAGLGSMIFDMLDPVYLPECWITFILKASMALVAGLIARGGSENGKSVRFIIAGVSGAVTYTVLYIAKTIIINYFVMQVEWETVAATVATKGSVSAVNAVVASVASILLNFALRPALKQAGLFDKLGVK